MTATALADRQSAFVAMLFGGTSHARMDLRESPLLARGLAAYRENGLALAARALRAAYPVVAQLLGDETFDVLARRLWRADPPQHGDVAQWGGGLSALLAGIPELVAGDPYVPDVARVEWALHRAACAADGVADGPSFGLLAQQEPSRLRLVLAGGTAVFTSAWPVATLVLAHQQEPPRLDEAALALREGAAECALVWRSGLRPRVRAASHAEHAFVAATLAGASLQQALDAAPDFDPSAWLPHAVQDGLLLGVHMTQGEPA